MLRFDGYYIHFKNQEKLDDYLIVKSSHNNEFSFIRFFENGKVVSATIVSSGYIKDIICSVSRWLNESFMDNSGVYHLSNQNHISFNINSEFGVVEYYGVINSDEQIILNSISKINGHSSDNIIYLFHPIKKSNDSFDSLEEIYNEYKH